MREIRRIRSVDREWEEKEEEEEREERREGGGRERGGGWGRGRRDREEGRGVGGRAPSNGGIPPPSPASECPPLLRVPSAERGGERS